MKESEKGESAYTRATESESAEHGPSVQKAIKEHQGGHVPFPTLGSSTPTSGGSFGGTKGPSGSAHNAHDTGFASKKTTG